MTRKEFLFTHAFPQRLYRHFVFWALFYLFSLVTYFHDGLEKIGFEKWFILSASETAWHIFTQILFCYPLLYVLLPMWRRKQHLFAIAGLSLLTIFIYWIYYLEHIYFFKGIHLAAGMKFRPPDVVYWYVLISLVTYLPMGPGVALVITILKNFYTRREEQQVLTRENANAELQLLKAQVHPHFLFNTLNNIYSFTLSKSPEASKLIHKLSDTVHYMITDCNSNAVLLEKELKMLEDYIGLEKVRYGDRLDIRLDITENAQRNLIAPLLMIPFVENCFKHGSSMMTGKQWIELKIGVANDWLDFNLSNSKPAAPLAAKTNSGIGLSNVRKRLSLLYPGKHQLNITTSEAVYNVQMKIQLQKN